MPFSPRISPSHQPEVYLTEGHSVGEPGHVSESERGVVLQLVNP